MSRVPMTIKTFGLPAGYELRRNFKGRFYALVETKERRLIIADFPSRPSLARCLNEISAWETLRANVRGEVNENR